MKDVKTNRYGYNKVSEDNYYSNYQKKKKERQNTEVGKNLNTNTGKSFVLKDTAFSTKPTELIQFNSEFVNKMNKYAAIGEELLTASTDIYSVTPGFFKQVLISKPSKKLDYYAKFTNKSNIVSPSINNMYQANNKLYRWANFTSPAPGRLAAPSIELISGSYDMVGRIVLDTSANVYFPSPKLKLILEIAKKTVNAWVSTLASNNQLNQYSCSEFMGLNATQTTKFITDTGYTANMLGVASLLMYYIVYVAQINFIIFRFQTLIRIAQMLPFINSDYFPVFRDLIRSTANNDVNNAIRTYLEDINYNYLDTPFWVTEFIAVNQCGKPTIDGTTEFRIADITLNIPDIKVLFSGNQISIPTIPTIDDLNGNWQTTVYNLICKGQLPTNNVHTQLEEFCAKAQSLKTFLNFLTPILDTISIPRFKGSMYMPFVALAYKRLMAKVEILPANNFWSNVHQSISYMPELTPAYNYNSDTRMLSILVPGIKTMGYNDAALTREYIKLVTSIKFDSLNYHIKRNLEPYARITKIIYSNYWFSERAVDNKAVPVQSWIDPATVTWYYTGNFTQWISDNQLRNYIVNRFLYTRMRYGVYDATTTGYMDCTGYLFVASASVYTQEITNFDYNDLQNEYYAGTNSSKSQKFEANSSMLPTIGS